MKLKWSQPAAPAVLYVGSAGGVFGRARAQVAAVRPATTRRRGMARGMPPSKAGDGFARVGYRRRPASNSPSTAAVRGLGVATPLPLGAVSPLQILSQTSRR